MRIDGNMNAQNQCHGCIHFFAVWQPEKIQQGMSGQEESQKVGGKMKLTWKNSNQQSQTDLPRGEFQEEVRERVDHVKQTSKRRVSN